MRTSILFGCLLVSAAAHAALPCSTPDLQLQMSLVLPSGDKVGDAAAPYVFGAAECQCHSTDLALRLELLTSIPIAKANGQLQVWVGAGCDQLINRMGSPQCRQVVDTGLDYQQFVQGLTVSGPIDLPLSSDALFGDSCAPVLQANNVYLLFMPDGDLANPEVCRYELQESGLVTTPAAPTATAADGAVTLTWSVPVGEGEQVPSSYQVLCADADGNPVPGKSIASQAYSVCNSGVLSRRNTLAAPGLTSPNAAPTSTFDALDPAFRCSEKIDPTGPVIAARINGLDPTKAYQFIVVAVDTSGNPVPSSVVVTTPPPPPTPKSNGCDYLGARTTHDSLGLVVMALLLVAIGGLRRTARQPC
jgi:hypothetical protein